MKAYRGSVSVAPLALNLGNRRRRVANFCPYRDSKPVATRYNDNAIPTLELPK